MPIISDLPVHYAFQHLVIGCIKNLFGVVSEVQCRGLVTGQNFYTILACSIFFADIKWTGIIMRMWYLLLWCVLGVFIFLRTLNILITEETSVGLNCVGWLLAGYFSISIEYEKLEQILHLTQLFSVRLKS